MEKQMNIPQLRFPEFEGDWEKKKLGKVVSNKSGKYNPEKETQSIKCIELEHLASETSQLLGYIDGKNSGSIKNKFEKGDVLFGKLRPYLKKYLLAPFEGVCSSEIWVLKGKDISNDFLFRIVQTDSFIDLANQSSGSKMPRADWSVVENGIFSFPTLPEQTKIATFLSAVDEKIQALKKKHTLLEQYKKGVMQKLFSQELRFKDENGNDFPEWEERKFEEITTRISTGLNPRQNFKLGSGNNYYVTIKNISNGKLDFSTCEMIDDNALALIKKRSDLSKNDIIMSSIGNIGEAYLLDSEPVNWNINESVFTIRYKKVKVIPIYLYYILSNPQTKQYFENYMSGSSFKSIKIGDLKIMPVQLPSLKEQTAIANFLSALDEKINHTQTQIKKTEFWKKGLLQKMFC